MNTSYPFRALLPALAAAAVAAQGLGPPSPAESVAPGPVVAPDPGATTPGPVVAAPAAGSSAAAWYGTRPRVDRAVDPDEAVALALRYSPVIAAMREDVEMARQMLAMARARTLPMIGANAWGTYGDAQMIVGGFPGVEPAANRMVPAGPSLDANFMAMYPLFTGGRLEARVGAERNRLRASAQDLQAMRFDLAVEVLTMVRRLTTMRGMIEVAQEEVATNDERWRNDEASFKVGRLPLANVLRNEAELANAQQRLANQVRDFRVMLADLKALVGVHPLSALDIGIAAEDPPPAAAAVAPVASAAPLDDPALLADLDLAARRRPELAGARARVLAAGHDLDAARAEFLPQVSLFGMADLFANRMNNTGRWEEYLAGVGVSLPLFDGGMRSAQVRRARAERARLTAQEQDTALRVAREVTQVHERLAAARLNVATARTVLASAREDYRLMQLRYQNGLALNVEVLDALRMRTMAAVNHLAAVQELAIATDEKRRATGDPSLLGQPAESAEAQG